MNTKEGAALNWIGAWIALVDNLVVLITLGYVTPGFEFNYICWRTIRGLKKTKRNKNE